MRVDGTSLGLALATDGNSRYVALDARHGAMIAVCEAARNVVATGATPAAVTNCLNFANPEHAGVWWDLHDAIDGIGEACRALDIPVVSGNVSLYNDTGGTGIDPTVVIGMVGVIDDVAQRCTAGFRDEGDLIALVGPIVAELDASEYQRMTQGVNSGTPPRLDIELERRVQGFILEAIAAGLLHSAHDCAEGGIAVALAESCLLGDIGAWVVLDELGTGEGLINGAAGILFGESQSRFVISFAREALVRLHELAGRQSVPFRGLGSVGGERVGVTGCIDVPLADVRQVHQGALIERE
jgi:phosphoribosylformylglycinamidine (FGAM) synthase-like enzyme